MKDRIFIPLMVAAALGLIGLSMVDLIDRPARPIEATQTEQGLMLPAEALLQISSSDGFPVATPPGLRGDQVGTRLASFEAFGPDAKRNNGARLLLGPATALALTKRPFSVVINAKANETTGAKETAVGLLGDTGAVWAKAPISEAFKPIRFDFPAQAAPPRALVFWAATEGKGAGIEVKSILLTGQVQAAPPAPTNSDPAVSPAPAVAQGTSEAGSSDQPNAPRAAAPAPSLAPNWTEPAK